jgi:hypothetical protein
MVHHCRYAGADEAPLTTAPLDPLIGAFSIVNALRPLEPSGGTGRVLLAFSPPDCSEYQEIITLRCVAAWQPSFCFTGGGGAFPPTGHTQRNPVQHNCQGPLQSLTSELRSTPLSLEVPSARTKRAWELNSMAAVACHSSLPPRRFSLIVPF